MPRYLVTGCAGFIGSTLVDALLAEGCEVIGVDSFNDYYPRTLKEAAIASARSHPGFTLTEHDLANSLPPEALDGADGIFHLAGRPGVRASWGASFRAYVDDNVLGTQRVVEQASSRGVRLVLASSSSIYGDALAYPTPEDTIPAPVSPYGVTKLAGEQLAAAHGRNAGLDLVVLRYFSVYGPANAPTWPSRESSPHWLRRPRSRSTEAATNRETSPTLATRSPRQWTRCEMHLRAPCTTSAPEARRASARLSRQSSS